LVQIISMLTGLFEPTKGTAFIDGKSIKHDMATIQQGMGICPQHDHLYDDLTAREHLLFYGRLKGFGGKELNDMVDGALHAVNLDDDPEASGAGGGGNTTTKRVKTFSGGMKRRLSVACSLMGNPSLVYMDEPSTGLDPASRRKLWDIISEGKKGRCIVLTTHSMEEADVLCDRIGIMAHGLMQCIGTASSLKLRFGAGFKLTVTTNDKSSEMADKVEAMVHAALDEGGARKLEDSINGAA
jgi:ABC-type multidrug transport system ATPase subunit